MGLKELKMSLKNLVKKHYNPIGKKPDVWHKIEHLFGIKAGQESEIKQMLEEIIKHLKK